MILWLDENNIIRDASTYKPKNHIPVTDTAQRFIRRIQWTLIGALGGSVIMYGLAAYGAYCLVVR